MRVLVIAPQPLFPLHDGLNLRVYHLFRHLARVHEVSLLCLAENDGDGAAAARAVGFAGSRTVRIRGEAGAPFRHCRDYSDEAARTISRQAEETGADVVVAASIYMVPYARGLACPVLLDLVDDMSLSAWRSLRSETRWRTRLRDLRAWRFWRDYERRELPAFPAIAVTSPVDGRAVRRHAPGARIFVVPNGVDAGSFRPGDDRPDPERPELVFTGVMGFRPNELAAIHFYRRIFPRVRARIPAVRLTIAGKGPTDRLQRLVHGDPGVTLTGYVPDIRPYIGRATLYVAPMTAGAGIKNKILEAWAMARPVVATSLACAGLEGVAGETHVVADSPRAFAGEVARLIRSPGAGDAMGQRARALVEARYSWAEQADRMGRALDEIVGRRSAPVAVHGTP